MDQELFEAASNGNAAAIAAALDLDASKLYVRDQPYEWTLLHHAAQHGHLDVVNLLLDRGARHDIFSAIAINLGDEVRSIVGEDRSALERPKSKFEDYLPLHFAVQMNRLERRHHVDRSGGIDYRCLWHRFAALPEAMHDVVPQVIRKDLSTH